MGHNGRAIVRGTRERDNVRDSIDVINHFSMARARRSCLSALIARCNTAAQQISLEDGIPFRAINSRRLAPRLPAAAGIVVRITAEILDEQRTKEGRKDRRMIGAHRLCNNRAR